MSPSTVRGFAAVYALLGLLVIGAGLGAYAAYNVHTLDHRVAVVASSLGDQNLTRLADKAITQEAQGQGFGVRKIVVKAVHEKGDTATVDAVVTVTDGTTDQTVELVVSFTKSTWTVSGMGRA